MPSFKNTFSDTERWSLVAFVRTLHKNTAPKVEIPAQAAKERAEKLLRAAHPDTDLDQCTVAMERALIRLQVAARGR